MIYLYIKEDFMADKRQYECKDCGNTKEQNADSDGNPECCGKPMVEMEPMKVCQASSTAEHSRLDDESEPCDDGRAG
jgi:hypothetical protein